MQFLEFFVMLLGLVLLLAHIFFVAFVLADDDANKDKIAVVSLAILMPFSVPFVIEWLTSIGTLPRVTGFGTLFWNLGMVGWCCVPFGLLACVKGRTYATIAMAGVVTFLLWRWFNLIVLHGHAAILPVPFVMLAWTFWLNRAPQSSPLFSVPSTRSQSVDPMPTTPPDNPAEDFETPPSRRV